MSSSEPHYDVIVIGSGAGGGTLAFRLAPSGKRILLLERGDFIPIERENWDEHEVYTVGRYRTHERWLDKDGREFEPFTHYAVGGNTKMYGGALFRLRESDFGEVAHFGGVSPAWPISYADLAPYYLEAEHLYSVHGARGSDPTEPPCDVPYPHAPLPHEPRMRALFEAFERNGLRPFPLPIAVRLGDDGTVPRPRRNLSYFDGFPDLTEAKADADVAAVRPALAYGTVTLRTNTLVERIETSGDGRRVTEVVARHGGEEVRFRGDLVVVACGAIASAALLLRSANGAHPDGLANASGLVGRNYMRHQNGSVIAISETPNESQFQKSFGVADFYHGAPDSPYPLGTFQLMGKTDRAGLESLIARLDPPMTVEEAASHSIDFWLTAEDLPDPENRVTLAPDGRIQTIYVRNNEEAYRRLREKLLGALARSGCQAAAHRETVYVGYELSDSGVSHQNGTLRFGRDPATSVLDPFCRAHGIDNLYVCDASFFPSCGAVNPSLTIMANALRVGDHLIDRLR